MKRILLEVVLALGLIGAGGFGWMSMQKGQAATAKLAEIQASSEAATKQLTDSGKELKSSAAVLSALRQQMQPLQGKALELDAVKAALANGSVLADVESLYKKQKALSADRQLGLGALRLLSKGSNDPGVAEAFRKALQMSDWGSRKKTICAAQIGLAAAGEKVKMMSECEVQPAGADVASAHGDKDKKAVAPDKKPEADADADKKAVHWGYEGEMGPDRWGSEFPTCAKGKSQSPLDIKGPFVKAGISVRPDYKAGPLRVLNNGHTIQVNVPAGSKLRVDGVPFELVQFHFHRPSEEQIDGKPSAMVVHFVHKNEAGKLVVLSVLLKEGDENPGIKTLWSHAPPQEGPEFSPANVSFNPANLLPRDFAFFSYEGSLTIPPCTEGVLSFILKTPVNISKEQVADFPFKRNARPVQPFNGRTITTG